MEYKVETSLYDFPAWQGGKDTLDTLIDKGDCLAVEELIETIFLERDATDEDINDFLWFDLQYLKEECRRYQLIKESLNFKIFERPLTDGEKFRCASKFFKSYNKLIKAHSMGKTSKFKKHYATR